jgi:pyruvate dehydrogenase E1 component alpha subunit
MKVEGISAETLRWLYLTMLRIRLVETRIAELLQQKEIKCPTHLYIGQEAVAAGVCANLRKEDYMFSTHRNHGHYLAKGGSLKSMMAELFGKRNGCSKGKGGSMHLVAPEVGILGTSAIVGSNIPLSAGAALTIMIRNDVRVSLCFLGDGSTDEGVFYETLNFASLKKLPVVFICENNFYAIHLHQCKRHSNLNIYQKAKPYNLPSVRIDGNDVIKVFKVSQELIESARKGNGPALIECITYRCIGHVGHWLDSEIDDRAVAIKKWLKRCPIKRLERLLFKKGLLSKTERGCITDVINEEIDDAIGFARNCPLPEDREVFQDVYKE